MNYFECENKQQELLSLINRNISPRYTLLKVIEYLEQIIKEVEPSLIEPFVCEIIPNLKILLKKFSPFGFNPEITHQLLDSIIKLSSIEEISDYIPHIEFEIKRIESQVYELENTLNGVEKNIESSSKVHFPIIEKSEHINYGLLDYLQVTLVKKKYNKNNEFLLHPSAIDVENRINDQVLNSWSYAQKYFEKNYRNKIPFFQIIINFEKSYAIYEGSSLGIALTIAFISELLNYFDLRDDLYLKSNIVSTGSVSKEGIIEPITEEIIKTKLQTVFFSNFAKFIIPKEDEVFASNFIKNLSVEYPKRKIEIIGVNNILDVINRRNLIEIKPKNIFVWGSRKLIKNKTSAIIFVMLFFFLGGYFYFGQDLNPNNIEFTGEKILIKNKFNKVLWYKEHLLSKKSLLNITLMDSLYARIIDINDDGTNEVLITKIQDKLELFLFDSDGNEIWNYFITDSIKTEIEKFNGAFFINGIIDTIHNKGVKELYVMFQHHTYYPSGISRVNLETGKQIGEFLWHPGSIGGAKIIDWNKDGKKEILAGGVSNGLHSAVFFSINIDELKGTFPTAENYTFLDKNIAKFNTYIKFPQTDYAKHYFPIYNAVQGRPYFKSNNQIAIRIYEGKANLMEADFGYSVRLDRKLIPVEIVLGDEHIVTRDKLVKSGVLSPPFTDTQEFHKSIKNGIEFWDGKKFVRYFEN